MIPRGVLLMAAVLLNAVAARAGDAGGGLLANPGFEAKLDGWSVHVYGARPKIDADADVFHEGAERFALEQREDVGDRVKRQVRHRRPSRVAQNMRRGLAGAWSFGSRAPSAFSLILRTSRRTSFKCGISGRPKSPRTGAMVVSRARFAARGTPV